MDFEVYQNIEDIRKLDLSSLFNSSVYYHYMHKDTWIDEEEKLYFVAKFHGKVRAFAKLDLLYFNKLKFLKSAYINFGPVFTDIESGEALIGYISKYLKKRSYYELGIQLAMPISSESESLTYRLHKAFSIKQDIDRINWSTIIIPLKGSNDEIFKSFKSRGRNDIRKALKNNLYANQLKKDDKHIDHFLRIYINLLKEKCLLKKGHEDIVKRQFYNAINFENSVVIGVFNDENDLIGGQIFIKCNNNIKYYIGASDSKHRNKPILHLGIWKSVKVFNKHFEFIDLGGYNFIVEERDQIYKVNKFKTAFSNIYLFYPRRIFIPLNKTKSILASLLKYIRK